MKQHFKLDYIFFKKSQELGRYLHAHVLSFSANNHEVYSVRSYKEEEYWIEKREKEAE